MKIVVAICVRKDLGCQLRVECSHCLWSYETMLANPGLRIQVGHRLRQHYCCPSRCHRLFPKCCWCKLQHALPVHKNHPQAWRHHSCTPIRLCRLEREKDFMQHSNICIVWPWLALQIHPTWLTPYASILVMPTVVRVNSIMRTVQKVGLGSIALNVVQENRSCSLAKSGTAKSNSSCTHKEIRYTNKSLLCAQTYFVQSVYYSSNKPCVVYPNWLQATIASGLPQRSSQIVPQNPPMHISTLPSLGMPPLTSLKVPSVQLSGSKEETGNVHANGTKESRYLMFGCLVWVVCNTYRDSGRLHLHNVRSCDYQWGR